MEGESPLLYPLYERHGQKLLQFINQRVQVLEGDVTRTGLGLDPEVAQSLRSKLDLIVNSSGLTDFNPDLRDALTTNVDAALNVVDFIRQSDHAGLLHLSTCYVAGARDGRVFETARPDYTPAGVPDFDAEREWHALHKLVEETGERAEGPEVTGELRRQAMGKEHAAKNLQGSALENQIRKNRVRWLRNELTEAGQRRARELGWPNRYTLPKGLAEELLVKHGAGLPVRIRPPANVGSFTAEPIRRWNWGDISSASLADLSGAN